MFILIVKLKNQLQVKWREKSKLAKVHLKAQNISQFVRFSRTRSLALLGLSLRLRIIVLINVKLLMHKN